MSMDAHDLVWHRSMGKLLARLDSPDFWGALVRLLQSYAQIDNWVVLIFSSTGVQFICCRESANEQERNALMNEYINGMYQIDPFFMHYREKPQGGFYHLSDIAPMHFLETEYYNSYFKENLGADESQYNVKLDADKVLCISLGCKKKFTQKQIAVLDLIHPWVIELMRIRMNFESELKSFAVKKHKWQDVMDQLGDHLTNREMEILKLLFSGFSNGQVSDKLGISVQTVRVHRKNFYAKLNIKSQAEFFALFYR